MSTPIQPRRRRATSRRTFDRSEYIGLRCPRDFKDRMDELSRKRFRDLSSIALEWLAERLEREEQQEHSKRQQHAAVAG